MSLKRTVPKLETCGEIPGEELFGDGGGGGTESFSKMRTKSTVRCSNKELRP